MHVGKSLTPEEMSACDISPTHLPSPMPLPSSGCASGEAGHADAAAASAGELAECNDGRLPVTAERPCSHNAWQRVRKLRRAGRGVLLRCFTCSAKWATEITMHHKCPEFYRGRCARGGDCPHPHIYARGTYPGGEEEEEDVVPTESVGSVPLKELRERTTQKRREARRAPKERDDDDSIAAKSPVESEESDKRSGDSGEERRLFRHDPYSPCGSIRLLRKWLE